jgi:hypothetical protein
MELDPMNWIRKAAAATALTALLCGGAEWSYAQTGQNPPVFVDLQLSTTPCSAPTPWVPFVDPCLVETQRLYVCLQIQDLDFNSTQNQTNENEVLLLTMESTWFPFVYNGILYGPEPPTVPTDRTGRFKTIGEGTPTDDYYTGLPPALGNIADVELQFFVPEFNGQSQAHLRGLIDYDVLWQVKLTVRNQQSNVQNFEPDAVYFYVCAVQNPNLVPGNPPPFADAGGDQLVSVGDTVALDGGRSFDQSNIGFSPFDPDTYDKDKLLYTWEWVDGPERVDPQPDPTAPPDLAAGQWPIALVTLEVANTTEKPYYVYRLLVDDGVNTPPSTDIVQIRVIPAVRENRAPHAVISDADGAVVSDQVVALRVGDQVQLSAQLSTDPDDDPLIYRWRQTNEVGGVLMPDEVLQEFQPLDGIADRDISWVATEVGTYYFSLLVADQPPQGLSSLSSKVAVTVDVAEAATAGQIAGRASGQSPPPADSEALPAVAEQPAASAACGGGALLPMILTTTGLWWGRRRLARRGR